MGIFERWKSVISAHSERAVERLETPDVLTRKAKRAVTEKRDRVYRNATEAMAQLVKMRGQVRQFENEATFLRKRAEALAKSGQSEAAQRVMVRALMLEQQIDRMHQQIPELEQTVEDLRGALTVLDVERQQMELEATGIQARAQTAEAIQAVAAARYGDPQRPSDSPAEIMRRAEDRALTESARGEAAIAIGASMTGDDSLDNAFFTQQAALEVERMSHEALPSGNSDGNALAPGSQEQTES